MVSYVDIAICENVWVFVQFARLLLKVCTSFELFGDSPTGECE